MSGTTTPPTTKPEPNRRGQIIISVTQQGTFLLALFAAAYLYWVTRDAVVLAILSGAIGVASTNATNIVGYWVGSSIGSDKKTDLMAANPPPTPSAPGTVTHTEVVTTAATPVVPVATPAPTPAP